VIPVVRLDLDPLDPARIFPGAFLIGFDSHFSQNVQISGGAISQIDHGGAIVADPHEVRHAGEAQLGIFGDQVICGLGVPCLIMAISRAMAARRFSFALILTAFSDADLRQRNALFWASVVVMRIRYLSVFASSR
jgi:hypothetical protein